MRRALTKMEIDQLFDFVRKKYVRYIDVQYEIVDHLASGIEEQMIEDEHISFEEALQNEYAKFPITGFSNWVTEKEKSLSKYWRKKLFSEFRRYLSYPRIMLTIAILLSCFTVILTIPYGFQMLFVSAFIYEVYAIFKRRDAYDFLKIEKQNDILLLNTYNIFGGSFTAFYIGILSGNWMDALYQSHLETYKALVVGLIMTVIVLWTHSSIHHFPKLLLKEIQTKYPFLTQLKMQ